MSIEDVDYLYKNSIKESSIILVDSSNRDKSVYKKPNSYTLEFLQPFKFVYGVEILDSSVPRTMYIIDSNNDTLYFYTTASEYEMKLDHRDYTLEDFISEINQKLGHTDNDPTIKTIQAYSVSIPASDVSKIFFSNSETGEDDSPATKKFYILAFKSNMRETIGLDENTISNSLDYDQITDGEVETISSSSSSNSTYTNEQIKNGTFKSGKSKGDHDKYEIAGTYTDKQSLQMPGLVNLLGDRYIKLRSDTIEQHLHSSVSASVNPIGLGLFKLGVSGYVDSRFDFINVKYREFHPIGKLASIDFRFETLDGNLYDFKGVNHNFLLNIKFLTPIQQRDKVDYVINPNYNPNLLEYKKLQYEKYDSDEDIENTTADFKNTFLKNEKKYDYSSDEDLQYVSNESDDDDEDDESGEDIHSSSSNEEIRNDLNFKQNRTIFHPVNYDKI
jgi:hypothetical protein